MTKKPKAVASKKGKPKAEAMASTKWDFRPIFTGSSTEKCLYKQWEVHHYTLPPEQYIACLGALVLRSDTLEGIKELIDASARKRKV